jgi:hypothetical protein
VVVFTQFDTLVEKNFMKEWKRQKKSNMQLDESYIQQAALNAAVREYDENYRGQFEKKFGRKTRVAITKIALPQDDGGMMKHSNFSRCELKRFINMLQSSVQWGPRRL